VQPMKILLFGCRGQVGWELKRSLAPLGHVVALDKDELDLGDLSSLAKLIRDQNPGLVVNASAYTAVDRAEREPELAQTINGIVPGIMAEEAARVKAPIIHFSTDYVFDGKHAQPYLETDTPNPINRYGSSKLAGEQAVQQVGGSHLILRTSWVYSLRGEGFVTKVLGWAHRDPVLHIVADQVGNPTWARLLAESVALLIARGNGDLTEYFREKGGLYHLAGVGYTSRYEWARLIIELDPKKGEQTMQRLEAARSDEFPTPAIRPVFSALDCTRFMRTFEFQWPTWQDGLRLAMEGNG
jgi:dTDP-4-dehydrorhamnose reductase